jgi:Flp pilus assembly protein TadG
MRRRLFRDSRGAAALEFAIIAPILLLLFCGMLVYGYWFHLGQSVQTLATEGARASIGGLDAIERRDLALAYIDAQAPDSGLASADLTREVEATATVTRVTVRLDVSHNALMTLARLLPAPPQTIQRSAVVLG